MDIEEIQKKIAEFVRHRANRKNFEITPEFIFIHLTEELGEVARQLVNKQIRPELFDEDNLKEEIVDVILDALVLSEACNISINEEIEKKMKSLFDKHDFNYE